MAQFARPSSDITTDWATTPLWSKIDEVTPDDGDFITGTGNAKTFEVKLSAVTDPQVGTGHIVRIRARATGSGGAERLNTWGLYQATTAIVTQNASITRGSFNEYSITLSEAQANSITDYSDLRIRGLTSQGTTETIDVSWAELEVPNAIQNYTITAQQGSYSISGQSALLPRTYKIGGGQGTYSIVGQGVNLIAAKKIVAEQGVYSIAGQELVLRHGYSMVAQGGSYSISGQDVNFIVSRKVVAENGSYAISGQTTNLLISRKVLAEQGSYLISGQGVSLIINRIILASQGSYSVIGQDVILSYYGGSSNAPLIKRKDFIARTKPAVSITNDVDALERIRAVNEVAFQYQPPPVKPISVKNVISPILEKKNFVQKMTQAKKEVSFQRQKAQSLSSFKRRLR